MISQKPPCKNRRVKISLLYDGIFSFAAVRQIFSIIQSIEPIAANKLYNATCLNSTMRISITKYAMNRPMAQNRKSFSYSSYDGVMSRRAGTDSFLFRRCSEKALVRGESFRFFWYIM